MIIRFATRLTIGFFIATASLTAHAELQYTCSQYGTGNDFIWWDDLKKLDDPNLDTLLFGVKIRDWKPEYLEAMRHNAEECMAKSGQKYSEEFMDSMRRGDQIRMEEALFHLKIRDGNLQASEAKAAAQTQREAAVATQVAESSPSNTNLTSQPPQTDTNLAAKKEAPENQRPADEVKRQQDEVQRQAASQRDQDERDKRNNLLIVLAVIAAAIYGWYWNKRIRIRCPKCGSVNYYTLRVNEISRGVGTKQVSERHSRGTNTRHVKITIVNRQYDYRCKDCQHEWQKIKREEF